MKRIEINQALAQMQKVGDIAAYCDENHGARKTPPMTVPMMPKLGREFIHYPAGTQFSSYVLGQSSLKNLEGVHPDLIWVVRYAIRTTEQDFSVTDGLRTVDEQAENVRTGVSQTMKSKHLAQKDGYAHAVDLVPWINGKARWELGACYKIMEAMRRASWERECLLLWGGAWVRLYQETPLLAPDRLVAAYADRKRRVRKPAFIDGPHYEMVGGW